MATTIHNATALQNVLKAVSTILVKRQNNWNSPAFSVCRIETTTKQVRLVGTNGYILIVANVPASSDCQFVGHIAAKDVSALARIRNVKQLSITEEQANDKATKFLQATDAKNSTKIPLIDINYVNYECVYNTKIPWRATVKTSELVASLNQAKEDTSWRRNLTFELWYDPGKLVFHTEPLDRLSNPWWITPINGDDAASPRVYLYANKLARLAKFLGEITHISFDMSTIRLDSEHLTVMSTVVKAQDKLNENQ